MLNLPATICLDGAAVRRIREEKRLTQLYVAKVVGVTTDTISRWENNRYPTVRRENLLKLGEALEVDVALLVRDDTLCSGEGEEANGTTPPSPPVRRRQLWLALGISLLLVCAIILYSRFYAHDLPASADFGGVRILPRFAAPGVVIPVRLRLEIDAANRGYIVREHFPKGWELIEASPPASSIDNQEGMARWIVKQGETNIDIAYLLRVDPLSPNSMLGRFRGEIIANLKEKNLVVPLEGDETTTVAPFCWADGDGDGRVDDGEMLIASQTFEEMEKVHLDWVELERLWDADGYRFDSIRHRFLPQNAVSSPSPVPPK